MEANLPALLEARPRSGVADLIARKRAGAEHGTLDPVEVPGHLAALDRLEGGTPSRPRPFPAAGGADRGFRLERLLVRLRTA